MRTFWVKGMFLPIPHLRQLVFTRKHEGLPETVNGNVEMAPFVRFGRPVSSWKGAGSVADEVMGQPDTSRAQA